MTLCDEPHPETGQTCHREGNHPKHIAGFGAKRVSWENEGWDPPRQYQPRVEGGKSKLVEMAGSVSPAQRNPLPDPAEMLRGKIREGAHDTEVDAALAVMPKTGTQRRAVLDLIASSHTGLAHFEMEERLEGAASPSSVRTRCSELVDGGWVQDSGARRQTPAGLDSIVWVLTPEAVEEIF